MDTYTVVGYWKDSQERYKTEFEASNVRSAEYMMLEQAAEEDGDFRIAGTMLGEHDAADLYTAFVNPDDPANDDRCDVHYVSEDDEIGEWTVMGIVASTRVFDREWNKQTQGERYLSVQMTTHPRYAEDMARAEVAERGHFELTVCAVFRGRKARCESFPFVNHNEAVK
jgi:hypothetical protein